MYSRVNPLLAALTKAGSAVSALGGLLTYLVVSGVISANQEAAVTTAMLDAQQTVAQVAGVVAGVAAALAGLAASLGTITAGKQGTTPTADPRTDDGTKLVPAPAPVAPVVDPNTPGAV